MIRCFIGENLLVRDSGLYVNSRVGASIIVHSSDWKSCLLDIHRWRVVVEIVR